MAGLRLHPSTSAFSKDVQAGSKKIHCAQHPHAGSSLMRHHEGWATVMNSDLAAPTTRKAVVLGRARDLLPATVRGMQAGICV